MGAVERTSAHAWEQWSTECRLVVDDPAALPEARRIVRDLMDRVTTAASRFEPGSELLRLRPGTTRVSPLLADLLACALSAARDTDGAVDPTVGGALRALGYDRDFRRLDGVRPGRVQVRPVPGWQQVHLDGDRLTLPPGLLLDLGATAKARTAGLAAARVADRLGVGVLVSLGGDLATAGPTGSWQVRVQDLPGDRPQQVTLTGGAAVATSSTRKRVWDGGRCHHLLDAATGLPVRGRWVSATVVAATCLAANTASTAAVVRGEAAEGRLTALGLPARLTDATGRVVVTGGFPRPLAEAS